DPVRARSARTGAPKEPGSDVVVRHPASWHRPLGVLDQPDHGPRVDLLPLSAPGGPLAVAPGSTRVARVPETGDDPRVPRARRAADLRLALPRPERAPRGARWFGRRRGPPEGDVLVAADLRLHRVAR